MSAASVSRNGNAQLISRVGQWYNWVDGHKVREQMNSGMSVCILLLNKDVLEEYAPPNQFIP